MHTLGAVHTYLARACWTANLHKSAALANLSQSGTAAARWHLVDFGHESTETGQAKFGVGHSSLEPGEEAKLVLTFLFPPQ